VIVFQLSRRDCRQTKIITYSNPVPTVRRLIVGTAILAYTAGFQPKENHMAAKKMGRPPLAVPTLVISVRVSKAEHAKISKAAKKIDRSISRVCAKAAVDFAELILANPAPQFWGGR
jgi:hypothetical protein